MDTEQHRGRLNQPSSESQSFLQTETKSTAEAAMSPYRRHDKRGQKSRNRKASGTEIRKQTQDKAASREGKVAAPGEMSGC